MYKYVPVYTGMYRYIQVHTKYPVPVHLVTIPDATDNNLNLFIWILANCDITVLPDITAPHIGVLRISQSLDSDIGVTDIGNSDITSPKL
jgi:hypothetical protein